MKLTSTIFGLALFGNVALAISSGAAQADSNLAARVYNEDLAAAARHHARSKRGEGLSASSHGQHLRRVAANEKAQRRVLRKKSCVAQSATATATSSSANATSTTDPATSSATLATQVAVVTAADPTTSTTAAANTTTVSTGTSAAASTSTSASSSSAVTVDTAGAGPFSGQGTWYGLGTDGTSLGSCGTSLVDSDAVAAVSHLLYDSWPGYAGTNPNDNPICGHKVKVSYGSKSVIVAIEDRCTGCAERDIDLSESAFSELADMGVGRMDITWEWVS